MFRNDANFDVNDAFQLVDVFKLESSGSYDRMFQNVTKEQTRSAASVIGKVSTPPARTYAFDKATGFSDQASIDPNWR
jgi:hypothetical protein